MPSYRLHSPYQEWPTAPKYNWRRQCELRPCRPGRIGNRCEPMDVMPHREYEYDERKRRANPEPMSHVDEFGICNRVGRGLCGLERHAANRTGAGTDLSN